MAVTEYVMYRDGPRSLLKHAVTNDDLGFFELNIGQVATQMIFEFRWKIVLFYLCIEYKRQVLKIWPIFTQQHLTIWQTFPLSHFAMEIFSLKVSSLLALSHPNLLFNCFCVPMTFRIIYYLKHRLIHHSKISGNDKSLIISHGCMYFSWKRLNSV